LGRAVLLYIWGVVRKVNKRGGVKLRWDKTKRGGGDTRAHSTRVFGPLKTGTNWGGPGQGAVSAKGRGEKLRGGRDLLIGKKPNGKGLAEIAHGTQSTEKGGRGGAESPGPDL